MGNMIGFSLKFGYIYIYITFLKSTKSLIAQLVFLHISSEDIQCSNPPTPNYFHIQEKKKPYITFIAT